MSLGIWWIKGTQILRIVPISLTLPYDLASTHQMVRLHKSEAPYPALSFWVFGYFSLFHLL